MLKTCFFVKFFDVFFFFGSGWPLAAVWSSFVEQMALGALLLELFRALGAARVAGGDTALQRSCLSSSSGLGLGACRRTDGSLVAWPVHTLHVVKETGGAAWRLTSFPVCMSSRSFFGCDSAGRVFHFVSGALGGLCCTGSWLLVWRNRLRSPLL